MDKVCSKAGRFAADPGHVACDEGDYPEGERCDGPIYETCENGEILTYDCRHSDPDFVCTMREGDQGLCTLAAVSPACEGITEDLHLSAGRCNGDVAEFCVSGKYFEVDCSAFQSATCRVAEGDQTVYCDASSLSSRISALSHNQLKSLRARSARQFLYCGL
jgi:hypothetical protein